VYANVTATLKYCISPAARSCEGHSSISLMAKGSGRGVILTPTGKRERLSGSSQSITNMITVDAGMIHPTPMDRRERIKQAPV
jgi:hypothetical protein